jgi:hypothetical protein
MCLSSTLLHRRFRFITITIIIIVVVVIVVSSLLLHSMPQTVAYSLHFADVFKTRILNELKFTLIINVETLYRHQSKTNSPI